MCLINKSTQKKFLTMKAKYCSKLLGKARDSTVKDLKALTVGWVNK